MVSIREHQYKIIDENVYLGLELEVDGESFYKNSKVIVEFLKDGFVVKEDNSWVIPMLVGEGIFCLGREFKKEFDFDSIEVSFEEGEREYEEVYNSLVEWSFNGIDEETRVISYKIKNTNKETIDYAILNLVFFYKGKLIAGTSLTLENLLNEREYYFEYQIPKEIEYTEVHPFMLFPSTNKLLFKGFYQKYNYLQRKINETSHDKDMKASEEFVNRTGEYNKNVISLRKKLEEIKKMPDQTTTSTFGKNLVVLLKNTYRCIPNLISALFDLAFANLFTMAIGGVIALIVGLGIFAFFGGILIGDFKQGLESIVALTIIPIVLILGICYIPYYIYFCFAKTDFVRRKNLITLEEKNNKTKECEAKLREAENIYNEYVNNIDKYKNDVVLRNEAIKKENTLLAQENKEVRKQNNNYRNELNALFINNPRYQVIREYDELDWEIVDNAINEGAYYFEDVEEYRIAVRTQVMEEREKMQEQLRQLEAEKRQEALQQQLVNQLEAVKSRVSDMQREQSELARQQLSYAASQAYAFESLNRKVGQMRDAQSLSNVYQENLYNKYH